VITHLPHQVESDVFSRTIVEVQNKSIPNVLQFVYSILASVNKHPMTSTPSTGCPLSLGSG
jgi:hypothetical protein